MTEASRLLPIEAPAQAFAAQARWAAIHVQGRDARNFLQGQLTQDLRALNVQRGLCAALCTAQGRVIACTWLVATAPTAAEPGIWIVLPDELAESAAVALRRYVLRAKVTISTGHEHAAVGAWLAEDAALLDAFFACDAPTGTTLAVCRRDGHAWLRTGPVRALAIAEDPAPRVRSIAGLHPAADADFELAAIRDGEPMVYAATREHWVPQMLNLDCTDAISFAKGCYTGQEIVTRTQHRGQIKRRMLRFALRAAAAPEPGAALLSVTGRAGEVVRSAADGADAELLAVVALDQANGTLRLENGAAVEVRPLPYPLSAA